MLKKAIVVAGGNKEGLKRLIGDDTEDCIIIGVDGGTIHLVNEGIIPDIAIGDFDSISQPELEKLEAIIPTVVKLPSEKDLTDTEAALEYIKENLSVAVIEMYGLFGGRVDHMISNLWLAYHPSYQDIIEKIIMKAEKNTVAFFKPGNYVIKKENDKKYLSFISMTPVSNLILQNVKYNLDGKNYEAPIALVSNEFVGEEMQFSFTNGLIAVIQSKD
ncbi:MULTISPECIES: thiamine diphosphokinase [unclassified Jeotgalibaca]|uniref:thiamine diphosphokinase n=1 Tax=unclassified Jeotgalibaca TaxID=2621505 RepID=UPI003FCF46FC